MGYPPAEVKPLNGDPREHLRVILAAREEAVQAEHAAEEAMVDMEAAAALISVEEEIAEAFEAEEAAKEAAKEAEEAAKEAAAAMAAKEAAAAMAAKEAAASMAAKAKEEKKPTNKRKRVASTEVKKPKTEVKKPKTEVKKPKTTGKKDGEAFSKLCDWIMSEDPEIARALIKKGLLAEDNEETGEVKKFLEESKMAWEDLEGLYCDEWGVKCVGETMLEAGYSSYGEYDTCMSNTMGDIEHSPHKYIKKLRSLLVMSMDFLQTAKEELLAKF